MNRDKEILIGKQGCNVEVNADLVALRMFLGNFEKSIDIIGLESRIEDLNDKNDMAGACRLW